MSGYSERHINRLFKSAYGAGPKDYCKNIRFQKIISDIINDPYKENSDYIANAGSFLYLISHMYDIVRDSYIFLADIKETY